MEKTRLEEFGRIDQTTDPHYFIRFLDVACAQDSFQTYKRQMLEWLQIQPGGRFLDVGCGTGDDAREMARLVGGMGDVVGIDNSQAMISEANQRLAGTHLPLEFHLADAMALPFEDGHFDGCRADRSLMHVPDAERVLAEMVRVARPGGRIAVFEVDFETLVIDAPDRPLARKVMHTWCDHFRNGWLGRYIPGMLRDLGLREVVVWPHTLLLTPALVDPLLGNTTVERAVAQGTITPEEGEAWLAQLDTLERTGRFFSTMTGFLVAGRK
jgi:ubiquinone/menaquinone biosynthesis C-methylase UbiE